MPWAHAFFVFQCSIFRPGNGVPLYCMILLRSPPWVLGHLSLSPFPAVVHLVSNVIKCRIFLPANGLPLRGM